MRTFGGSGNKSQMQEQSHCKRKEQPQAPSRSTHTQSCSPAERKQNPHAHNDALELSSKEGARSQKEQTNRRSRNGPTEGIPNKASEKRERAGHTGDTGK